MKTTFSATAEAPQVTSGTRALRYVRKSSYDILRYVILFVFGLLLALLYQRFVLSRDIEGAATAFNG